MECFPFKPILIVCLVSSLILSPVAMSKERAAKVQESPELHQSKSPQAEPSKEPSVPQPNPPSPPPPPVDPMRELGHKRIGDFFPSAASTSSGSKKNQDKTVTSSQLDFQLDPREIEKFENNLDSYIGYAAKIGLITNPKEFRKWWYEHSKEYLNRPAMVAIQSLNLETFLTLIHIRERMEVAAKERDAGSYLETLLEPLHNPQFSRAMTYAAEVLGAVVGTLVGMFKGAMIAGPVAGVVGALVEPLVRMPREWAVVMGAKLFNKPSAWLNKRVAASASSSIVSSTNKAAIDEFKARLDHVNWTDLTPQEVSLARSKLIEDAVTFFNAWQSTNAPSVREGRAYYYESAIFRPVFFAQAMTNFDTNMTLHKSELSRLEDKVSAHGMTPALQASINEHKAAIELAKKQKRKTIQLAAAGSVLYPEFSDSLPHDLAKEVQDVRVQMGLDKLSDLFDEPDRLIYPAGRGTRGKSRSAVADYCRRQFVRLGSE